MDTASDVMNEHTTGQHNVMQNIAKDAAISNEGVDVAQKTESGSVEGYNNFKKLHATEKSKHNAIYTIFCLLYFSGDFRSQSAVSSLRAARYCKHNDQRFQE